MVLIMIVEAERRGSDAAAPLAARGPTGDRLLAVVLQPLVMWRCMLESAGDAEVGTDEMLKFGMPSDRANVGDLQTARRMALKRDAWSGTVAGENVPAGTCDATTNGDALASCMWARCLG